jgi:hypothetical protein
VKFKPFKALKRAVGGALKKPLKTAALLGGLALGGVFGAGAKSLATKGLTGLLGKGTAGKLLAGKAGKVFPWVLTAMGAGGGKQKKIKPETWTPQLLQPFYEPGQAGTIGGALYQQLGQWAGYSPAAIAGRGAATTSDLAEFAALQAIRPTDWQTVASQTAGLMRPLFEQQLGRQMQMLHEQLAAAAGTGGGGAILEAMSRFAGEQERGWQSMLADLAQREMARQQEMAQRWAMATPELFRGALGIAAAPSEMTMRIAEHLRGMYGGTPVYPMYAPSLLQEAAGTLGDLMRAGIIRFDKPLITF